MRTVINWVCHIANVGKVLKSKTDCKVDKIAREKGTAVYGSKMVQLFYPMLPTKMRENLSLNCNKKASTISISCEVSIVGKNIELDHNTIRVHESCVCSRAQLTYENAQDLLNGVKSNEVDKIVKNYNKMLSTNHTFGLEQRLAVLLQISEFLFRHRTQSDEIDYPIENDEAFSSPQAYFLVSEMMI